MAFRGSGRTHLMLRCALSAARAGKKVLVVMKTERCVDYAKGIFAKVVDQADLPKEARDAAVANVTFAKHDAADDLRARGGRFDYKLLDHTLLPRIPGASWLE